MTNIQGTKDHPQISIKKNSIPHKLNIPKKWWLWGGLFLLGLVLTLTLYGPISQAI